jgi:hypothetical protein
MLFFAAFLSLVVVAFVWVWWRVAWMPGVRVSGGPARIEYPTSEIQSGLRRDLNILAGVIGERNISQRYSALVQSAEFIEHSLTACGCDVRRQEFEVDGKSVCNLIAEIGGTTHSNEIIVVGAHYDTVTGSPGANDNGSAVIANLALARLFADAVAGRTLRFAFFVNEEMPYHMTAAMGALRYAEVCRAQHENVIGMIALETIGYFVDGPQSQRYPLGFLRWFYPTTGNFLAFVGNAASRGWIHQVIRGFRETTFPSEGIAAPEWLRDIFRSDHAAFWQCGYRALMVTDTANFRYPFYHTPEDTPDKINYDALTQVVVGLAACLRAVSNPNG